MITNPSNLSEQLSNLCERIAQEIKSIYAKLKTAVYKINGIAPDENGNVEIPTNIHVGTSAPTTAASVWIDPTSKEAVDSLDFGKTTDSGKLLIKRGTTAQVNAYTGLQGELVLDTNTNVLYVQTGSGRKALISADDSTVAFAGTVSANSFQATSDERLKDEIVCLDPEESLERVLQLKPSSYLLHDDIYSGKRLGVIAQEALKVAPEIVKLNNNGMYSVDYYGLIALCVASTQKLEQRIKDLESK
jgi:hypothetical protein